MKHLSNSWTLFCGTLAGLLLLMASQRPELQSRETDEGPGKKIAIAGHVLTWSTGGVLAYRMVRSVRKSGTHEEVRINTPPADAASQPGEPPLES